ncbi:MAG: YfhO family protein, partial [Oscillospiraceae bacterium]|nr:YfhO family protein [Oscillospiraceae bacterium]
ESVIGVLCAMFLMLPSLMAIMGNGRLDDMLAGWNLLFYGDEQRYGLILQSFFLPPDIPARPNFFPDSNAKWASVAAYLPMFSFAGVIAFLKSKKSPWASLVTKVCIVIAFIPGLNAIFTLFNYNYYARWYYMPLLIMAMMTALSLEDRKIDLLGGIKWTAIVIGALSVIGITPSKLKWDDSVTPAPWWEQLLVWGGIFFILASIAVLVCTVIRLRKKDERVKQNLGIYILSTVALSIIGILPIAWYGQKHDNFSAIGNFLPPFVERFWAYVVIGVIGLAIAVFVLSLRKKRELFMKVAAIGICFVTVAYSVVFIAFGKSHSYSYYDVVTQGIEGDERINLPQAEGEFYRVDVYDGMDNYPMFWGMPTIQAFHSIVPASVLEFYPEIGVERGVGSRPELKHYGLRGLTSVKYLLTDNTSDNPYIPGFEKTDHQNGFDIYENTYYIPMGFTYDQYITRETFGWQTLEERDRLLLEAILLSEEQIEKYGSYYTELAYEDVPYFSDSELKDVCEERSKETCSSFVTTQKGFNATITPSRDTLVYFSVPYDKGWSATVNGEKVTVEKVNIGFMAVPVKAGQENTIVFEYTTPGLYLGILISLVAFLLLLGYYLLFRMLRKKNPEKYGVQKYAHFKYTDSIEGIKAGKAYTCNVAENCRILSAISNTSPEEEQPVAEEELVTEPTPQSEEKSQADSSATEE